MDLDKVLASAFRCEIQEELVLKVLCERVKDVLEEESNVKIVEAPCTVVGDVHGQFHDIIEMFRIGGNPPETNYVFLGDYVDRGPHSVETITLLLALKLKYPSRVTLLRGNHESRAITQVYGFYMECMRKFGSAGVWTSFTDAFDYLPIAAVIGGSILALHGGLSPSVHALDQLRILDRFSEIPHEGPIADIMWSDPDPDKQGFVVSPRGAGYVFGYDVARKFLWMNNLDHIVRAHQLCMSGYQLLFKDECVSTVWSAPNYCYRFANSACVLEVNDDLKRFYNVFDQNPEFRPNPPPPPKENNYFL